MSEPLVLILTASAGAGHVVAARALEEEFRRTAPSLRVENHDLLTTATPFFRALYAGGYLGIVRHWPAAFGALYDATDRPHGGIRSSLRIAVQNINLRRAMRLIETKQPALIVNTHFLPAEIVAQLRRRGRLNCPQATVTTDFQTHALWANPPTERYFTATREGAAHLAACGVSPECVRVTGIPVRAAFRDASPRDAARATLGLEREGPIVLMLCGGFGVGPVERLLRELLGMRLDARIAVIAGKNEPLRARLERAARGSARRTSIVGFTDAMHVWMRAADVVVTKPGGLSASEALVCGVPLVLVNPIPGQETRNADYLLEHGAAIRVAEPGLLGFRVETLLADEQRMASMRSAAIALGRPDAAREIVAESLRLLV